jgi:hypothetical protein
MVFLSRYSRDTTLKQTTSFPIHLTFHSLQTSAADTVSLYKQRILSDGGELRREIQSWHTVGTNPVRAAILNSSTIIC